MKGSYCSSFISSTAQLPKDPQILQQILQLYFTAHMKPAIISDYLATKNLYFINRINLPYDSSIDTTPKEISKIVDNEKKKISGNYANSWSHTQQLLCNLPDGYLLVPLENQDLLSQTSEDFTFILVNSRLASKCIKDSRTLCLLMQFTS
jgi:hypothetical protein